MLAPNPRRLPLSRHPTYFSPRSTVILARLHVALNPVLGPFAVSKLSEDDVVTQKTSVQDSLQVHFQHIIRIYRSYWRPQSRTVEVCQNIRAGSVNYCRPGWYDDVPDVILNGFWPVPEAHTLRPQA